MPSGENVSDLFRARNQDLYSEWLSDGRRLLVPTNDALYLVDSQTKTEKKLLDFPLGSFVGNVTISPDDRTVYFSRQTTEADLWLMTFE